MGRWLGPTTGGAIIGLKKKRDSNGSFNRPGMRPDDRMPRTPPFLDGVFHASFFSDQVAIFDHGCCSMSLGEPLALGCFLPLLLLFEVALMHH